MKKFPFLCLIALFCAAPALAQNGVARYRFDNFDTQSGVRIAAAEAVALPPANKVRLTSKSRSNSPNNSNNSSSARATALIYSRASNMAMTVSKSLDGFTTGNAKIDSFLVESAARNGIDPVLLYAIMHQESTFKPRAISNKGARGLMQLMPGTAARFGVGNIFDPRQNIEGGARYVRFLLDTFDGDVALTLAGYNAGEGAVIKYGRQVPPYRETQEYVRRITNHYALMRDPMTAHNARRITPSQVATVQEEAQSLPLTVYERNVFAVRLPDGRFQLISQ